MCEQDTVPNILVIDDEPTIHHTLALTFELLGYRSSSAACGKEALALLEQQSFDLGLLDLHLPDMHGMEVFSAAQSLSPNTAMIIVTAYGSLDSAVNAMRQGAFDYLLKPCSVDEIIKAVQRCLRVRQHIRRQEKLVSLLKETLTAVQADDRKTPTVPKPDLDKLKAGPITLDTQWRAAIVEEKMINLSSTEYDVIHYLACHLNQVISCQELVKHTHGVDMEEQRARSIIRMHIHRLRQKLEPTPHHPRYLRTVRGVGYMLVNDHSA